MDFSIAYVNAGSFNGIADAQPGVPTHRPDAYPALASQKETGMKMHLGVWSLLMTLDCSGILTGFATGHVLAALAFGTHGAIVACSAVYVEDI
jgi:hypothetical protein